MRMKTYRELSESNFSDLQAFFKELLSTYELEPRETRAILLDVVGGVGFKKETVVVDTTELSKEISKDEEIVNSYLDTLHTKHKDKIRKSILRDGRISFTYR
jgi:hypothetical protein